MSERERRRRVRGWGRRWTVAAGDCLKSRASSGGHEQESRPHTACARRLARALESYHIGNAITIACSGCSNPGTRAVAAAVAGRPDCARRAPRLFCRASRRAIPSARRGARGGTASGRQRAGRFELDHHRSGRRHKSRLRAETPGDTGLDAVYRRALYRTRGPPDPTPDPHVGAVGVHPRHGGGSTRRRSLPTASGCCRWSLRLLLRILITRRGASPPGSSGATVAFVVRVHPELLQERRGGSRTVRTVAWVWGFTAVKALTTATRVPLPLCSVSPIRAVVGAGDSQALEVDLEPARPATK